ncbi:MAG: hypothetical protein PVI91_01240 [Gammaproteobacteria bacterium]|jgi:hypothetical protein
MDYVSTLLGGLFWYIVITGGLLLLLGVAYLLSWPVRAWDESRRLKKERAARLERFRRQRPRRRLVLH